MHRIISSVRTVLYLFDVSNSLGRRCAGFFGVPQLENDCLCAANTKDFVFRTKTLCFFNAFFTGMGFPILLFAIACVASLGFSYDNSDTIRILILYITAFLFLYVLSADVTTPGRMAAACPTRKARFASSPLLTTPRMPSVPKYLPKRCSSKLRCQFAAGPDIPGRDGRRSSW